MLFDGLVILNVLNLNLVGEKVEVKQFAHVFLKC
jgi:hypothetical protein